MIPCSMIIILIENKAFYNIAKIKALIKAEESSSMSSEMNDDVLGNTQKKLVLNNVHAIDLDDMPSNNENYEPS